MGTTWQIYTSPTEAWDVMLEDVRAAKRTIKFEQYIFTDYLEGGIGKKFAEAFIKKAEAGVSVRILVDIQGSKSLLASGVYEALEKAGAEISFYTASVQKPKYALKAFFRDHKKLLVIDDTIAHIGGMIEQNEAKDWCDLNVRLEGEIAEASRKTFDLMWGGVKETSINTPEPYTCSDGFMLVSSGPQESDHHILRHLIERVEKANSYILIVSPYYVPPMRLHAALMNARARGVFVDMILPREIDNSFALYSTHRHFEEILSRGVCVHLYDFYIHAKAVLIDDRWCTFGSANIDMLALLHNYELNVESERTDFVCSLHERLAKCALGCEVLLLEKWRERPLMEKFYETASAVIRPLT